MSDETPFAVCPKCSCGDVGVAWHENDRFPAGCGSMARVRNPSEHLHYTCRRCQYEWTGPIRKPPRKPKAALVKEEKP